MAWIYLAIAGVLEVVWAIGMKYSDGFKRPLPGAITMVAAMASFYSLSLALQTLPVGTAYAVWTGIGAVGTVLLGILLFQESTSAARLACIVLIVVGILGLKWTA
jgi:quaternary ammonium compound-resistance protein SugE